MRSPKHSTGSALLLFLVGEEGVCSLVFGNMDIQNSCSTFPMQTLAFILLGARVPLLERNSFCLFLNKVSCSPICSWTHYPARDDPELWFSSLHLSIIGLQTTPSCPTWETNLEASIWVLITRVTASMPFSWDRQNNVCLLTHVWKSSYIFCAFVTY